MGEGGAHDSKFNYKEASESGWNVAVWTGGASYDVSWGITVYVEVIPPAGFTGKHVLEVTIDAPTIGGGRSSYTLTTTEEFSSKDAAAKYCVPIKDAFLSDTGYGSGSKPLNLGRHKVAVKIRTEPGPTFLFDDLMVNVALMNH